MLEAKQAGHATATGSTSTSPRILENNLPPKPQNVSSAMELVTPEIASKWLLELNDRNRPLSKHIVKRYADEMRKRTFKFNGEPVTFNDAGKLHNGQHRLHGIVESGIAQYMLIVRGVPSDSFDTVDTGMKRQASHILAIAGSTSYNNAAAAIRLVLTYKGRSMGDEKASPKFYDNAHVRKFWEDNPAMERIANKVKTNRKLLVFALSPSVVTTFYFLAQAAGHADDVIETYLRKVANGEELKSGDPILTLRNKLVHGKVNVSVASSLMAYNGIAMLIRAFNAHVEGRQLTSLYGIKIGGNAESPNSYPAITKARKA